MRQPGDSNIQAPRLNILGRDLLVTTSWQRWLACTRPLICLAAYITVAQLGWWWLTPFFVFLIFVAIVTVTHDIVHESLGLSPRLTEWALFRRSHLQHHRVFPGPDDPEGDPARMGFWVAVLHGPVFLPRLWWWAYRRADSAERRWLLLEAGWALTVPGAGILIWPWAPAVLVYAMLVWVGSWVYPLLTVHLPHHDYGETPLTQTSSLRGRLIPALFLELTYHLEHHLYPAVPSQHLPELARRLDPFFQQVGVKMKRVP
jgi:beta-carotene hydroxylase